MFNALPLCLLLFADSGLRPAPAASPSPSSSPIQGPMLWQSKVWAGRQVTVSVQIAPNTSRVVHSETLIDKDRAHWHAGVSNLEFEAFRGIVVLNGSMQVDNFGSVVYEPWTRITAAPRTRPSSLQVGVHDNGRIAPQIPHRVWLLANGTSIAIASFFSRDNPDACSTRSYSVTVRTPRGEGRTVSFHSPPPSTFLSDGSILFRQSRRNKSRTGVFSLDVEATTEDFPRGTVLQLKPTGELRRWSDLRLSRLVSATPNRVWATQGPGHRILVGLDAQGNVVFHKKWPHGHRVNVAAPLKDGVCAWVGARNVPLRMSCYIDQGQLRYHLDASGFRAIAVALDGSSYFANHKSITAYDTHGKERWSANYQVKSTFAVTDQGHLCFVVDDPARIVCLKGHSHAGSK